MVKEADILAIVYFWKCYYTVLLFYKTYLMEDCNDLTYYALQPSDVDTAMKT